ncbi:hypothetical protein [Paremcibacter congregatus]|uniref:hypothetical protein n=1 Tax=Paremcibacter congregatus TaxID=2043170 RepID=UPI0030EDB07C
MAVEISDEQGKTGVSGIVAAIVFAERWHKYILGDENEFSFKSIEKFSKKTYDGAC